MATSVSKLTRDVMGLHSWGMPGCLKCLIQEIVVSATSRLINLIRDCLSILWKGNPSFKGFSVGIVIVCNGFCNFLHDNFVNLRISPVILSFKNFFIYDFYVY